MNPSQSTADQAFADLVALTDLGIRFHGTDELAGAAAWLQTELEASGHEVQRHSVTVPGWTPGAVCTLVVTEPQQRAIHCWPLLWSGSSQGPRRGRVIEMGPEGMWGDSMVWRKFLVIDEDGSTLGYIHGRDNGPAAPQPLPSGSDYAAPHFAIGRTDSDQLSEWIADDKAVFVTLELDSAHLGEATSDNLIVDIAGTGDEPAILVCAHYDTFWNTPGAYDNGSGTIALLHLAREWAITPPKRGVRLVFFTGEEWHLSGSRSYVANATQAELDAVSFVLNIDGLGRGAFLEAFAAPERFEVDFTRTIRAYAEATRPGLKVVSRFPPTTGTDDAAFYDVGVPSGFMTFNDLHRLHQPDDLPNREIAASIAWTTGLVLHLVQSLVSPDRAAPPALL